MRSIIAGISSQLHVVYLHDRQCVLTTLFMLLGNVMFCYIISYHIEHWCLCLFAGELLDTLPPGIDEAVAISKVVQFLKSPEYSHFQHIVFDTAPTGHTLRLLTLPDFLDKTIGDEEHIRPRPSPPPPPPTPPLCHQFSLCVSNNSMQRAFRHHSFQQSPVW